MAEYRQRMLNSPKSAKVLEKIFEAALDDDHKFQSAAWKLIIDRIAPLSGFDNAAGGSVRTAIQVNITGVPGVSVSGLPLAQAPEDPEDLEGDLSTGDE